MSRLVERVIRGIHRLFLVSQDGTEVVCSPSFLVHSYEKNNGTLRDIDILSCFFIV